MRTALLCALNVFSMACADVSGLSSLVVTPDDAGADAADAAREADASVDSSVEAVACGAMLCSPGQKCCFSRNDPASGVSCRGSCSGSSASLGCATSSQCAAGQTCCASKSSNGWSVACAASCTGVELCLPGAPCNGGGNCVSSRTLRGLYECR